MNYFLKLSAGLVVRIERLALRAGRQAFVSPGHKQKVRLGLRTDAWVPSVRIVALATAGLLSMSATAASAATVTGPEGAVLVSQGGAFKPITGSATVAPGARVMVRPGAVARISYEDGCSLRVGSGRVWTIRDQAPCKTGMREVDFTGRMNDGVYQPPRRAPAPVPVRRDYNVYILGGAVVGGALLIGCLTKWCRDDDPSSP